MHKFRSAFRHRQSSIIAIQCCWRRKLAKREFRKLKQVCFSYLLEQGGIDWLPITQRINMQIVVLQAANETGALRLAKTKLEKRLEDLEWRLQLEKRLRVCSQFFRLYSSDLVKQCK